MLIVWVGVGWNAYGSGHAWELHGHTPFNRVHTA